MNTRRNIYCPVALVLTMQQALCGCSATSADAPGLTQSEQALQTETRQFNETVAVPAVLGALAGAALGGILCKNNKAACAAGGAAAGGLIGGGAGYVVATQNRKFSNQEEELRVRIEAAKQEAQHYDRVIAATNQVIAEERQQIGLLKQQYRAGQVTLAAYQAKVGSLQQDKQAVTTNISANQKTISVIDGDLTRLGGPAAGGLAAERNRLLQQQEVLKKQLRELTRISEASPSS